ILSSIDNIITTIEERRLIPEHGRIVVAVSGGTDSLCLLHLLHRLCGPGKRYPDVQLCVAHLDHQLRGEASEQDAVQVARLAEDWGLPVVLGKVDVSALARRERRSLEDAARVARYRFLREVAHGDPIAVAHHLDDQVETLLLHWLRGGGLASMVGLQPRQQDIIRPLLSFTHAQTLAYCVEHRLPVLEDASNSDTRFLRNRIRHELVPLLETLNPGFRETLLRNADIMQVDFAWIEEQVALRWSEVVESVEEDEHEPAFQLRVHALLALPLSLQRHLLRSLTARLSAGQSPLELRHYRLIEDLLARDASHETLTLHMPNQIRILRTGDILVFKCIQSEQSRQSEQFTSIALNTEEVELALPGFVRVPGTAWIATADRIPAAVLQQLYPALECEDWQRVWSLLPVARYVVYIDSDKVASAAGRAALLSVRTRRDGDRIQPLGMKHEKKVQDVLIDKHILREERTQIPLFFSAAHCVWLAGVHLDERVRLTRETKNIVRLTIISSENEKGHHA
ncbi:MAG: tRNA lysidine(34) synthetase TilS, partial [Ktedonobacteraceae bacterium]|nr:tRNA lysidine(34) synthetase TilS [Ktedonobacteraceae bacterium]